MARMAASVSLSNIKVMYRTLSLPTPCSPVIDPPASMHAFIMAADAASTRSTCSRSLASKLILGCRFPSPA